AAFVYFSWIAPDRMAELQQKAGANILPSLAAIAVLGAAALVTCRVNRGLLGMAWVLGILWMVYSLVVSPQINGERSARDFMAQVQSMADPDRELALMEYKEQFLLYLTR